MAVVVRAWRLVRRRHIDSAFDGSGSRWYGGRWNSPGTPVVYAADSRALAALEVLAGTGRPAVFENYVVVGLSFDDQLASTLPAGTLPADWRVIPPSPATQRIGDAWVKAAGSAVLRVPSVIMPAEFNLLLNPAHPDFATVSIGEPEAFGFDRRLR